VMLVNVSAVTQPGRRRHVTKQREVANGHIGKLGSCGLWHSYRSFLSPDAVESRERS
jgi:hypothetical protein